MAHPWAGVSAFGVHTRGHHFGKVIGKDDQLATKEEKPSDVVEVINQAILRDDQVDINLDSPPDQSIENEKYQHLTEKDIPLEDLKDTNADTSTVDQPVIKLEILLDIDEDTLLDTDMDDANTFVSLETTSVTGQNLCNKTKDCGGITWNKSGRYWRYELRRGTTLKLSPSKEVSYLKRCN